VSRQARFLDDVFGVPLSQKLSIVTACEPSRSGEHALCHPFRDARDKPGMKVEIGGEKIRSHA
jgi:hypothetical protein